MLPQRAAPTDVEFGVRPQGLATAAGIIVFSPAAHSFFPAVMMRMEEPTKFPVCLRRAYGLACLLYLCIACLGYYFFGDSIQPSLVKHVGFDLAMQPIPGLGWMHLA